MSIAQPRRHQAHGGLYIILCVSGDLCANMVQCTTCTTLQENWLVEAGSQDCLRGTERTCLPWFFPQPEGEEVGKGN